MSKPSRATLKQASQDYYAAQRLPEASLKAFEQQLGQPCADTHGRRAGDANSSRGFKIASLAAAIAVAALLNVVWWLPVPPAENTAVAAQTQILAQQKIVAAVAAEVSKNHIKLKPLEVTSTEFNKVRDYFTALDFLPQASRYFPLVRSQPLTMAGGRYCSILSQSAAQLRYRSSSQTWSTLYQTAYNPETFGAIPALEDGAAPIKTYSKGLRVTLWVERQLLMVSVEDTP